ncbi:tape measure protein [Acinetobacter baumannii]|uniref:Tape measure protein n=3 Tax=Acinetobacter baumannii TaxID=470 RepID=A0A090BCZ2_ACIBA|nr:tape measure protein [Acinetobacter baumannii]EKX9479669.1 tape measure protein [Acinetobacter baumannii]KMV01651.1 tape measure domain protein [Acinetobacter baumannii]KMV13006.1 tape measure domain protein [Acinetobacter baumannii]MCA4427454.1 tape measure protein [Acinetobacter baumannii]MCG6619552.1 tape measure protein [Acinetobacter baumannii]
MAQESRLVIVIDSQNAERNARNLGNELVSIERKGEFASKSMDSLSVATRALAGHMAGLVTVGAAISKMDTYTGLQNRLKLVTNNQAELNKATEDTFQIAQKTYSAWDSVLQVYQRFSDNAKTLNLTMDDTARLTETVSKAVAISGASAEAADAALVQFGQALASGTLRGEELNSVMEQTPALAKAIAQGMGITVGELRSIAAEGKITSQEIVKALRNVEKDVDTLFAKTDITIGQSLTLLNNEITKFVGESGKGSGAAEVLSGSIKTLAGNLDVLTSAMMVGGAYWLGTYIPAIYASGVAVAAKTKELAAQTITQYAAIQAERASAAQQVISTQAVVANTQATLAAIAAEKALEVQRLKSQITEKGRTATITRMAELKKIEAQVTRELAVAEGALATAQARSAAAGAASVGIGSRLLGLLGGPVGIGITVASLAAGYLLMRDTTAEANKKLEEQARVAEKTDEALKKLAGNDKTKAVNDLTDAFNAQNEALKKSSLTVGSALIDIENYARGNREVEKISQDARTGTISYTEAIERLNKIKLPTELYENLKKQAAQYDQNSVKAAQSADKLKIFGVEVTLTGNKAQNAAAQHQQQADALGNTASEAEKATKALQDYQAKQKDSVIDSIYKSGWLDKGYTVAQANAILELQKAKGMSAILSKDEIDSALRNLKIIEEQQEREDKLTEAKRKQTQEIEKQAKLTKRLVGISGQSGIGTGPHLDVRYGGSLSGQKVSNEHLARLQAGGKPLTSYKISSNYGPRKAPTKGASSFHKGIDFLMPEGTPITTNVAVKDIKTWYDSKGGGYVSEVIFEDGVSLKLLHQSPKMQSKVKGGASKGSDKAAGDIQSQLDRQLDAQRSLENEVASEVQRIQNNLKVRLEDVDKAGFSPERTAEIKAELQRRADNDVAIAKQAIRSKLEDYKEFRKTEEQLLEESFNRKKFNAAHDIELSKSEQKQAVELLEQQKQQELGLLKLAQEQRLFQARLSLLSETQAMQERYRLEREEIHKNTKLSIEERQKLIALSKANQDKETRDKVNNAVQNWVGIQADMNGTGEFFRQDQERFSRLNAANDLADSQFAATDLNEQNSLDGLNAQFEAGLIKQQDYENQKTAIIQAAQDQRNQIAAEYAQNAQDIEDKYHQDRLNAQIALGGQMMGSLTSMFGSMFGEQSKAYKIMFAADKAYAIAAAGIAIQQNIAAASKAGFPLNIPLIAGAVAQGASIIANIRAIKDQGFADGGYTGRGGKYEVAGAVHKGEIVWSQEDIKRWGGVGLVERMRKSANPEAFLNNNASTDSVMRRAMMSSNAFIESQKQSDIFNQPVQATQIIYKGNRDTPKLASSANSDLFHDGKVYFSSNGLVQDRSNLGDVQDFTLGRTSRPQAEIMPSIEPASPTINFKIEVINQVSGATVEAEQLDEQSVRIIVKDELDKQLPRTVPKLVSDQIANPNSTISRSLTENTTARRNRT